MTQPAVKRRYTVEDYLRLERDSSQKHEFHDGEILAMSGGTPTHSLISMNVGVALHGKLKGNRGRIYDSNLRISVPRTRRYVYPDATVVCGPLQFDPADAKQETVINPRVIIEVLSPSTESYDRRDKFDNYRLIESLQEYVLVSQDSPRIEVFLRQTDGAWAFTSFAGLSEIARLRSVDVEIPLTEAFAGVEFPPPAAIPSPEDSKHE